MSKPVRRSQAISPFGIGAIVDFPGPVSLVHCGLDAWPFDENNSDHREFVIADEKRLAKRLGVDYFVEPPDFRRPPKGYVTSQINQNLRLPFLRFPLWHVCPRCGRMHKAKFHDVSAPVCTGPVTTGKDQGAHKPRRTVQVRFVSACSHGHLQDLPWLTWLFKEKDPDWSPDGVTKWLRLRSTGSASLVGVEVSAEERMPDGSIRILKKATLAGVFGGSSEPSAAGQAGENDAEMDASPFSKLKVYCDGKNPALAIGDGPSENLLGCGQPIFAFLRGASNLYFAHVVSSIYIPEIDDRGLPEAVLELLDDQSFKTALLQSAQRSENGLIREKDVRIALREFAPSVNVDAAQVAAAANTHLLPRALFDQPRIHAFLRQQMQAADGQLSETVVATALRKYFPEWDIPPSALVKPLQRLVNADRTSSEQGVRRQDPFLESAYRFEEYRVFCQDVQEGYPKTNLLIKSSPLSLYGDLVNSAFERVALLHKVRETKAFVGFSRIYPDNELTPEDRWRLIASKKRDWLPGTVVRGEGIFLKFREDRLAEWLERYGDAHSARLTKLEMTLSALRERRHQPPQRVSPKHILIHTFAHLLINQLVYECGYSSASLKERIYSSEGENEMSGVLIYTAAGDSEGTMGGLVKMGAQKYLDIAIAKALERARWCSTDPVCIESGGQGPDNCNLAACHACALLPETSCEEQNRMLDRGVLIGTLLQPQIGFFSNGDRNVFR